MALDGVAAAQARIAQIQAQISAISPNTVGALGSSTSSSSANGPSPAFASLLADAMASGTDLGSLDSNGSSSAGGNLVGQLTQLAQLGTNTGTSTSSLGASPLGTTTGAPTNAVTQQFLNDALAQKGKPYVYGATASLTDPNPKSFDCSELTKWAAARVGTPIPDGATAEFLYIRDHGTTMPVQQALHTPGALLFHFGHEPKNLGDIPADGHVAISLGDGQHTIEARGHKYGTNVFDATGTRAGFFNYAGMIPGMT